MLTGVTVGVTVGVLRLLKYSSRAQLQVLAKLCRRGKGFDDAALLLEARKGMQKVLEKACEAGKVSEEDTLNRASEGSLAQVPPLAARIVKTHQGAEEREKAKQLQEGEEVL